jgi:hypothetical protein
MAWGNWWHGERVRGTTKRVPLELPNSEHVLKTRQEYDDQDETAKS